MKKSKAMKIIEKVALKKGVSISEVRAEMVKAIDIAYENRTESSADFWDKWRGRKPTPEEFIVAATKSVLDNLPPFS